MKLLLLSQCDHDDHHLVNSDQTIAEGMCIDRLNMSKCKDEFSLQKAANNSVCSHCIRMYLDGPKKNYLNT
jgi:hypothetical protein